jgi:hypothetical protein
VGRLFIFAKGEYVMVNDKDNVTFSDLEGRDFKEIIEITAPRGENVNGVK